MVLFGTIGLYIVSFSLIQKVKPLQVNDKITTLIEVSRALNTKRACACVGLIPSNR